MRQHGRCLIAPENLDQTILVGRRVAILQAGKMRIEMLLQGMMMVRRLRVVVLVTARRMGVMLGLERGRTRGDVRMSGVGMRHELAQVHERQDQQGTQPQQTAIDVVTRRHRPAN